MLLAVAIAASARVAYWIFVTPDYVPLSDAGHYHDLATNLADGRGYVGVFPQLSLHATAWRPPGFPTVLGIAYAVFGSSIVVGRIVNVALGCAVVVLAGLLGAQIGCARAGTAVALLVAVYPPLIANDVTLLSEPLSLLLLLLTLRFVLDRNAIAAGVGTGALLLTKPSAQALVVVLGAWVLWKLGVRRAAVFGVTVLALVTPWIVRNWVQLGAPVLVTSNGFNLAAVYSPEARASHDFVDPVLDPRFERFRLTQFDEIAWDRSLRDHALESLRDDPVQIASVVARNARAYFEISPIRNRGAEHLDGRDWEFRSAMLPFFYVVTAVGVLALWRHRKREAAQLIGLVAVTLAGASLLLVAAPRLRAPVDLVCCIGTGSALATARTTSARTVRLQDVPRDSVPPHSQTLT